ncbi:MAG TPA: OmpA family protein, partial [Bacteroidia bacterium]|nr:OmpA family protein [Bacteroidia bacterium]
LVPNPSFEELTSCPFEVSVDSTGIAKAKYWFTTDKKNSPDLLNECNRNIYGVSVPGTQNLWAKTGKGYAGIASASEHLEIKLKSPLVKNKTYRVQMYVSNLVNAKSALSYTSNISFCFSNNLISKKDIEDSLINRNTIGIVKNNSDYNHSKWKLFSADYKASGGEIYFAFGGFINLNVLEKMLEKHIISPYYYIDDVSVKEIDSTVSTAPRLAFQGKLVIGQKLELKNIFFETSKANLLSTSDNELDKLAKAMQNNLSVSLNIFGYTDNTGNETSNIELSTKRAEAVRNYLVKKGIDSKRLNCKGFGSTNPVADNKTEKGRKNNRRVEIEVK